MKEAINKFYIHNSEVKSVEQWVDYDKTSIVYEVIKIVNGKPLFYEEHYKRMEKSLKLKGSNIKITYEKLLALIRELIIKNEAKIGNIKIINNLLNENLRIFFIYHKYPDKNLYCKGINTTVYFGERNNPNVKVMDVKFRKKVNEEIEKKKVYEAILVDSKGLITEGSKSNIFFIKENILYTPKSHDVLPGVTRTEIIKEAKSIGIKVEEVNIKLEEVSSYEAAFISGTSPNILPIRSIDDNKFDVNNEFMRDLMNKFDNRIKQDIY